MMKWFRRNKIKVTTADLYDKRADLKLDITKIDLPDESYDMVIANHVLEHVSSYEAALSELRRILKPDGTMIVSFPPASIKKRCCKTSSSSAAPASMTLS